MNEKNGLQKIIDQFDRFAYHVDPKIERDIEENRKGQFRFLFQNEKGEPLDNVKIKLKQTRHAFHFGATTFFLNQMETPELNAAYEEKFKKIFNYGVIPLYWDTLEPEEGKARFEKDSPFISRRPPLDEAVEFCEKNGLDMKGHCLIYNSFQPKWLSDDNREIKIKIEKRLREISERYGEKFLDADVINEMLSIYKNCYTGNGCRNLQITDERDHEKWCFDICKRYFPHTRLFWNEGMQESIGDHYRGHRSYYYMALREWLSQGAPIEGIGMQYHAFWPYWKGNDLYNDVKSALNPLRQLDVFDCYGEFGLPIHLSEVSIPSWTGEKFGEDEEAQAEVVKRLYKLWFSRKHCQSIVWWNFADDTAFGGENIFHGGLIHRDCTEKPAYRALDDLINREWRTNLETTANKELRFSGFYGTYEAEISYGGKTITKTIRLHEDNTGYDNRICDFRAMTIVL
jgi:GH35 family endo-1,4-beta-xylanase